MTRTGYTFKGWYEDSSFSGSDVTEISSAETGDKTFYAKWEEIWNKNMRSRKFANMQIQAVRKTHILDCYQEMMVDGVGNGSITLIHKVLSAMFNHALSEDYIRMNYTHGCTKELGIYNNKRDALTRIQQEKFLQFIRESSEYNAYYWMFEFFFETGVRCGETIGLTWQNVDFQKQIRKD